MKASSIPHVIISILCLSAAFTLSTKAADPIANDRSDMVRKVKTLLTSALQTPKGVNLPADQIRAEIPLAFAELHSELDQARSDRDVRNILENALRNLEFQPIEEAPKPEQWPSLTPVGWVEIKDYPAYRAAVTRASSVNLFGSSGLFFRLFNHISSHDISMTAPVEMVYNQEPGKSPKQASMAFLYQSSDIGSTGKDKSVEVVDQQPATFASIGIRGSYAGKDLGAYRELLAGWVERNAPEWQIDGPIRVLGYNSPGIPSANRYAEIQVPLKPRDNSQSAG